MHDTQKILENTDYFGFPTFIHMKPYDMPHLDARNKKSRKIVHTLSVLISINSRDNVSHQTKTAIFVASFMMSI